MAYKNDKAYMRVFLSSQDAKEKTVQECFTGYVEYHYDNSDTFRDMESWMAETSAKFSTGAPIEIMLEIYNGDDKKIDNMFLHYRETKAELIGGLDNLCSWVSVQLAKFARIMQVAEEVEKVF